MKKNFALSTIACLFVCTSLIAADYQKSTSKTQTKGTTKKADTICGENCLCTKLTEEEVKSIVEFVKQQKERQAAMEKFRQQNPNAQFGNFRGRGNAQPKTKNQVSPD